MEKTLEQRIAELEKKVAELEGQVQAQPEVNVDEIVKIMTQKINNKFIPY